MAGVAIFFAGADEDDDDEEEEEGREEDEAGGFPAAVAAAATATGTSAGFVAFMNTPGTLSFLTASPPPAGVGAS